MTSLVAPKGTGKESGMALITATRSQPMRLSTLLFVLGGATAVTLMVSFSLLAAAVLIH
jgi:hypothetical protein